MNSASRNTVQPSANDADGPGHAEPYILRRFITGVSDQSREAVRRVQHLCATRLAGNFSPGVSDLAERPPRERVDDIAITPTLIKESPLPHRSFSGSLPDLSALIRTLDLKTDAPQ